MKGGVIVKDRATYNKEFAARLKRYMDRAGLRAVDLSRATGISGGTLSEYLKGKYVPKQMKLYKIAEALHTTPAVLTGTEDCSEIEEDRNTPSFNLLEVLFKDNPAFLKKISHIEMTGKINEPGVIAKLTKQQQDRIRDIITLTYEEAVRNGGIGVVHTVSK